MRALAVARRLCTARVIAPCEVHRLGRVTYSDALALMERLARERHDPVARVPDALLLLEHDPPVFTLGRGNSLQHLRFDCDARPDVQVLRTSRGGQVTFHGPGQLVAYPILNLNRHRRDLHWYVRQVRMLRRAGPRAARVIAFAGRWRRW